MLTDDGQIPNNQKLPVKGQKLYGRTRPTLSCLSGRSLDEELGYELYHSAKLATHGSRLGQRHSDNRGKEKQGNVGIYVVIEQIGSYLESELGKASRGSLLMKLDSINDWE